MVLSVTLTVFISMLFDNTKNSFDFLCAAGVKKTIDLSILISF